MQKNFRVDITHQLEVRAERQVDKTTNTGNNKNIALVDEKAFIAMFRKKWPKHTEDVGRKMWHNAMGNFTVSSGRYTDPEEAKHPSVHFLTEESASIIIDFPFQFFSGIDYQNLPLGFYLIKNPEGEERRRDVLHYSKELKQSLREHGKSNPLRIVIPSAADHNNRRRNTQSLSKGFAPTPHRQKWYDILTKDRRSMNGKIKREAKNHDSDSAFTNICSLEELNNAFLEFERTLKKLDLPFFDITSGQVIKKEYLDELCEGNPFAVLNPIRLIASWVRLLKNPQLKPKDRKTQLYVLPELPLATSYHTARAMDDGRPGLVIAGMQPKYLEVDRAYTGLDTTKTYDDIIDLTTKNFMLDVINRSSRVYTPREKAKIEHEAHRKFWRYIAFQPKNKRYSETFYRKALSELNRMGREKEWMRGPASALMMRMLAGSTTGDNYSLHIQNATQELAIWKELCTLIENFEKSSDLTVGMSYVSPEPPGSMNLRVLCHATRLNKQPTLLFGRHLIKHISDFTKSLSLFKAACQIVLGEDPFKPLEDLSNRLNANVEKYGSKFYLGARWMPKSQDTAAASDAPSIEQYIDLVYKILTLDQQEDYIIPSLQNLYSLNWLLPEISTFGVTEDSAADIRGKMGKFELEGAYVSQLKPLSEVLTFAMTIFVDASKGPIESVLMNEQIITGPEALQGIIDEAIKLTSTSQEGTRKTNDDACLEMLDYLKGPFKDYFPENYFETKKQHIQETLEGKLTTTQSQIIDSYEFKEEDQAPIRVIAIACMQVDRLAPDNDLDDLIGELWQLHEQLTPSDYSLFLSRFKEIRAHIPDLMTATKMVSALLRKRTTEAFNTIFLQQQMSPCSIEAQTLLPKIIAYINHASNIDLSAVQELAISRTKLQEVMAHFYLKLTAYECDGINTLPPPASAERNTSMLLLENIKVTLEEEMQGGQEEGANTSMKAGGSTKTGAKQHAPLPKQKNHGAHEQGGYAQKGASGQKTESSTNVRERIKISIERLIDIFKDYPHIGDNLVQLIKSVEVDISPYHDDSEADYLDSLENNLAKIKGIIALFTSSDTHQNMSTIYSLIKHYKEKPQELMKVMHTLQDVTYDQKSFFLTLLSRMLDSGQSFEIDELTNIVSKCAEDNTKNFALLKQFCSTPPYPQKLSSLQEWLDSGDFEEQYNQFSQSPFGSRKIEENAFRLEKFPIQKARFKDGSVFAKETMQKLNEHLVAFRTYEMEELRVTLEKSKKEQKPNKTELLAMCIEFLARTASQTCRTDHNKIISQELNTTQVMTLYTMIMQVNNRIMNQIDTGEGKSRILMVLAAFHALQGKTVDLITANMQLSERDYLQYKQFFTALGVKSSLITLSSPPDLYQKSASVNFSDFSQLLLRRSQSQTHEHPEDFLDTTEENRVILCDEVDQFLHDGGAHAYNFAEAKNSEDTTWIYQELMDFMQTKLNPPESELDHLGASTKNDSTSTPLPDNKSTRPQNQSSPEASPTQVIDCTTLLQELKKEFYTNDEDECVNFVAHLTEEQLSRWIKIICTTLSKEFKKEFYTNEDERVNFVAHLTEEQLSLWFKSALTAQRMRQLEDYVVTEKLYATLDAQGHTRYVKKILPLDPGGRPMHGSTFADGIQQFLCVLENQKTQPEGFLVSPETQTVHTSYASTFLTQYHSGHIIGVSGTTRAETFSQPAVNPENIGYIVTPPHHPCIRQDLPPWVATSEEQQMSFLQRLIVDAIKADRPVLIICKNDLESLRIYQNIEKKAIELGIKIPVKRVHGTTTPKEETTAIEKAGKIGQVTISNAGMFSRGVDIDTNATMEVIATYVPTAHDSKQIKGRTGRYGQPGRFQIVPNCNDPDYEFNGQTSHHANPIDALQKQAHLSMVRRNTVASIGAVLLDKMTSQFLVAKHLEQHAAEKTEMADDWRKFLDDMRRDKSSTQGDLEAALESKDKEKFIDLFETFANKSIHQSKKVFKNKLESANFKSDAEQAFDRYQAHAELCQPTRQPLTERDAYDPSDDGQARIYSSLFVQTTAWLQGKRPFFADFHAWRDGRGALFPDMAETLNGDRPLFANLRATISKHYSAWKGDYLLQDKKQSQQQTLVSQSKVTSQQTSSYFWLWVAIFFLGIIANTGGALAFLGILGAAYLPSTIIAKVLVGVAMGCFALPMIYKTVTAACAAGRPQQPKSGEQKASSTTIPAYSNNTVGAGQLNTMQKQQDAATTSSTKAAVKRAGQKNTTKKPFTPSSCNGSVISTGGGSQ